MRWMIWGMLLSACVEEENTKEIESDGESTETETEIEEDLNLDSDGDGYTDAEELQAGTDPNDAEDRIYQGGWPYNMNKDSMQSPDWDSTAEVGAMLPEYIAQDQFGDFVNLNDLAGRGKKIVLDVGTQWCGPCKALAAYLSTNDMSHLIWNEEGEYYPWWKEEYSGLYDMVQNEDVYWVTILFSANEPYTTWEDAAQWEEDFPNEKVIVMADSELSLYNYLGIESYPAISVLDENMNFLVYSPSGPSDGLREVCLDE